MNKQPKPFRPIPVLTRRIFHANRGRNGVALLATVLTTLMFTTLFTLTESMSRNLVEMTFRQTGYRAQASIRALTEEEADALAAHPDVTELGRSLVLGLAGNPELTGTSVEIRWADATYAKHSFAFPTTGRMPEAEDEMALDTLILDRLGIPHELGQTVTLAWRKDPTAGETISSSFTLCGFWDGNQSSYSSMAWVSRAYADNMTGGVLADDERQILGLYMLHVSLADYREIMSTENPGRHHQTDPKADLRPGQPPVHPQHSSRSGPGLAVGYGAGSHAHGKLGGQRGCFCQPHDLYRVRPVCLGNRADLLPAARPAGRKGFPHRGSAHERCGSRSPSESKTP